MCSFWETLSESWLIPSRSLGLYGNDTRLRVMLVFEVVLQGECDDCHISFLVVVLCRYRCLLLVVFINIGRRGRSVALLVGHVGSKDPEEDEEQSET